MYWLLKLLALLAANAIMRFLRVQRWVIGILEDRGLLNFTARQVDELIDGERTLEGAAYSLYLSVYATREDAIRYTLNGIPCKAAAKRARERVWPSRPENQCMKEVQNDGRVPCVECGGPFVPTDASLIYCEKHRDREKLPRRPYPENVNTLECLDCGQPCVEGPHSPWSATYCPQCLPSHANDSLRMEKA